MLQQRFMDIERIELVKGPQSALYGRSAFNGALQYVTADPTDEFEADILLEGGEFDRYSARGSVSGPLGDKWGYRLNAAVWDEAGFYENSRTGDTVGGADGWGGAVTLKWEPTEQWGFKFRASYTDQDREPEPLVLIPANAVTAAPAQACADQFAPIFEADGVTPTVFLDGNDPATDPLVQLGSGLETVFECVGFGLFQGRNSGVDLVRGTNKTVAELIEGEANRLANNPTDPFGSGVPLTAGPIGPGNQPIAFYMGSAQSQNLRAQFRGTLPDQDDVGPVALDPDPRTGKDFPGSTIEETRLSLIAEYDADWYTFTSWTGYMDGRTHGIQDWQHAGDWDLLCGTWIDPETSVPYPNDPATGEQIGVDPDASCRLGYNNNRHELTQFSQELRFASKFDGWQQVTAYLARRSEA